MKFSRRTVLRAAGGFTLALPSFSFAADAPPKRFLGIYTPNGVFPADWHPTMGAGGASDFTLGKSMSALQPFKDKLLLVRGLDMKVAVSGPGEQHQRGLGGFLTGQSLQTGTFIGNDGTTAGWANGESIDQTISKMVGAGSKASSLQLGVHCLERDVSGAMAYSGPGSPLLPQNDPLLTFSALFSGSGAPPDEAEKLRRKRQSILDAVRGQISAHSASMPKSERTQLDAHLTFVRELEERITALPPGQMGTCMTPSSPGIIDSSREANMPEVAKLQLDMLALAFSCDLTRCATIAFSDAKNHIGLPFLNISSDIHNVSHLGDSDPQRAQLAQRDKWQCDQLAYFLGRLKSYQEGQGTVLDNTLVLWGSEVSMGNTHSHSDMPFLLAGGAAGFKLGRALTYGGEPHNNLLVSILQGFGAATTTTYGNPSFCTGALTGLT